MSLREQIAKDISGVFLNENDFARPVSWDGQTVTAIEDREKLTDLKSKRDDLRCASLMLYMSAEDVGNPPTVGAYVKYENRRYTVVETSTDEGMYAVILEEVRR